MLWFVLYTELAKYYEYTNILKELSSLNTNAAA